MFGQIFVLDRMIVDKNNTYFIMTIQGTERSPIRKNNVPTIILFL